MPGGQFGGQDRLLTGLSRRVSVVGPAPAALIGRVVSRTLAAPPELPSPTHGGQQPAASYCGPVALSLLEMGSSRAISCSSSSGSSPS
jgi:hypothetical protein